MKRLLHTPSRIGSLIGSLLLSSALAYRSLAQPAPEALAAFSDYVYRVEARLGDQHRCLRGFLAPTALEPGNKLRLRAGEVLIERLTASSGAAPPGALLHHWRGTAFAPGARAADLERLLRDFNSYPQRFAPEVLQARVLRQDGDRMQASMRVRQRHVLTVVMDASYDVSFGRLDAQDR